MISQKGMKKTEGYSVEFLVPGGRRWPTDRTPSAAFLARFRTRGKDSFCVTRHHIDLEIHALLGSECSEGGHRKRMRNESDREFTHPVRVADPIDRQAHTIEGDRTLICEILAD